MRGGVDGVELLAAEPRRLMLQMQMYAACAEPEIRQYWQETAATIGAQRAVLIHWDDFFVPLTESPRPLPYAGDDLTISVVNPAAD